jgi:type VI secretion system protein VasG
MSVNLKSLIGKLNSPTRSALEAAAGLCLSRTHYNVEIEHYLLKLMEANDSDVSRIFYRFGINTSRLSADLTRSLDKLKSGNARTPAISPTILKMMTEAWTLGSIDYGAGQIRSGFTVLALLTDDELARIMRDISKELVKLEAETLKKEFISIVRGSVEDELTAAAEEVGTEGAPRPAGSGKTQNINQFTVNLSEKAKSGKLDPVLGRDAEVRQIIDILMRRRSLRVRPEWVKLPWLRD